LWCVSRFEASHESKVNGWGKIQDTTSYGLMPSAVSSLIAPPDKIAMLSISRSAALGGCQVAPRAAAKNLKSLLQADRIRFFDLQLPAWNRRKHHQASTADDFHIIFRTFEELWQLLLLCVFRVGSTRCVAVQSWVEDLVISSRIRDSVMRSTWYVQYEPKTGHHGQGPKICLNFKTSLAPSIVLPLKGVVPAPFLCWRAAYCEEELTWQQSR
jgi:hypothetical protein